jgi:uncharacterized protein YegL
MGKDFDIESFLDNVEVPESEVVVEPGVAHVPVILLLDTSSSMLEDHGHGRSIDQLNRCLQSFFRDVIDAKTDQDRTMRTNADFCIIAYDSQVSVVMPWTHGSELALNNIPVLDASGSTAMYEAIVEASDLLLRKFATYKKRDVDTYCANIFNITDGMPNTEDERSKAAYPRAKKAVKLFATAGKQENPYGIFYHVGVPGFSRDPLLDIAASNDHVIELADGDISKFFQFIRASLDPDRLKLLGE